MLTLSPKHGVADVEAAWLTVNQHGRDRSPGDTPNASMAEWPIASDCRSDSYGTRWFESISAHLNAPMA